jgi:hypothetical protein
MTTNAIHPEEEFIQLVEQAIEYGAENRNDISQEVFSAAFAIPFNLAYFIKGHGGQLGTHQVHTEFRAIPAYFSRLDTLSQQGHALRENSLPAVAPAQPQEEVLS